MTDEPPANPPAAGGDQRSFREPRVQVRPRVRRPGLIGLAGLLVVLAAIVGVRFMEQRWSHVYETDARVQGEMTTIASRLDGWVTARPVIEGDRVRKGQMLAELDARQTRLKLAELDANLSALDAQIARAVTERDTADRQAQASVASAQAGVTAAEARIADPLHQLELAHVEFARADSLTRSGAASRQDWDRLHTSVLQKGDQVRQSQADLATSRAALAEAEARQAQVAVLDRQVEVLRRQRTVIEAQRAEQQQDLEDRTLRAPFDGVVDRTFVHVGDFVQPGQWLLMLHDPRDVWVEANIKETNIAQLRVGQPVTVGVDAYPDLTVQGHVLRIGDAATNQFALLPSPNPSGNFTKITQRVPVRIALDRLDDRLRPGLMTEVAVDVAH